MGLRDVAGGPELLMSPLTGGQLGGDSTDFVVVEWTDAGNSPQRWIAPRHVHHEDDEAWYVLGGTLRFWIGEEEFEAGAGDAVLAARGVPHTYGNARAGEPARYLLVMTPRIRSLIRALHEPGAADPRQVFRDHRSELLE